MHMQDVYADLSGNVLLHASVPAVGLRAAQWAIISWGRTHAQLPDLPDSRFTYRPAPHATGARRSPLSPPRTEPHGSCQSRTP